MHHPKAAYGHEAFILKGLLSKASASVQLLHSNRAHFNSLSLTHTQLLVPTFPRIPVASLYRQGNDLMVSETGKTKFQPIIQSVHCCLGGGGVSHG